MISCNCAGGTCFPKRFAFKIYDNNNKNKHEGIVLIRFPVKEGQDSWNVNDEYISIVKKNGVQIKTALRKQIMSLYNLENTILYDFRHESSPLIPNDVGAPVFMFNICLSQIPQSPE
jgi:hypothetical protein